MTDTVTFAEYLVSWRNRQEKTRTQAAQYLGATDASVGNWERGYKVPHWPRFEDIMWKLSNGSITPEETRAIYEKSRLDQPEAGRPRKERSILLLSWS